MTSLPGRRLFIMWASRSIAILTVCLGISVADCGLYSQTAGGASSSTRSVAGCTLRIHVDGLRNSTGNVGTVVFSSADGWPFDAAKAVRIGPAAIPTGERKATAIWEDLPPGDYGVAAIHDENSNAKLDKDFLGIPKEGFGFANNPRVLMGPAPFKQALVHVGCPATDIVIHIQYK